MNTNTNWGVAPPSQSLPQQSQNNPHLGPYTVPPPGPSLTSPPPPLQRWSPSTPYTKTATWDTQKYVPSTGHSVIPVGQHQISSSSPQSQYSVPPPPHGQPPGLQPSHSSPVPTLVPQLGITSAPPPGPPPHGLPTGPPPVHPPGPPPGLPTGPPPTGPPPGPPPVPPTGLPPGPPPGHLTVPPAVPPPGPKPVTFPAHPPGPPPVPLQNASSGISPMHGHTYRSPGVTSVPPPGSSPSDIAPLGSCSVGPQTHTHSPPTASSGMDSSSHEAAVLEFLSKGRNPFANRHSISPPRSCNNHRLDREMHCKESCERTCSGKNGYRDRETGDCKINDRNKESWSVNGTDREGSRKCRSSVSNKDKYIPRSPRRGSLDRSPEHNPRGSRLHGNRERKHVHRKGISSKERRELDPMRADKDQDWRRNRSVSPDSTLKENQRTANKRNKDNSVTRKRTQGGRELINHRGFESESRQESEYVRKDSEGNRRKRSLSPDFPLKENKRTALDKSKDGLIKNIRSRSPAHRQARKPVQNLDQGTSTQATIRQSPDRRSQHKHSSTSTRIRSASPTNPRSRDFNRSSPHHSPSRSSSRHSPNHSLTRGLGGRGSPDRMSSHRKSSVSTRRVRSSSPDKHRSWDLKQNRSPSPNPAEQNQVRQSPRKHSPISRKNISLQNIDERIKRIDNEISKSQKHQSLTDSQSKFKEVPPNLMGKDGDANNCEEEVKPTWLRSSPADLFYQKHDGKSSVTCATDMLKNLCQSMDDKIVKKGMRVREEKIKQREQQKIEKEKLMNNNINKNSLPINPKESNTNDKAHDVQLPSSIGKQNPSCEDVVDSTEKHLQNMEMNNSDEHLVNINNIGKENNKPSKEVQNKGSNSTSGERCAHDIKNSGDSSATSLNPESNKSSSEHTNVTQLSQRTDVDAQIDGNKNTGEATTKKDISSICVKETGTMVNEACEPGEVISETEDATLKNTSCSKNNDHHHHHKHSHKKSCRRKKKRDYDSDSSTSSSDSDSSDSDSSSSSSSSCDSDEFDIQTKRLEELERRRSHPDRLHEELWFNDPGEMNDGPLCRCSLKAQRSGIRHGYYLGEEKLETCDPWSNNADRLYHYLVTISPPTNFLVNTPTVISHIGNEFIFEGFSLLSHHPLKEVPTCRVIRFNIEYTILYYEEKIPDNFCIKELDLFYDYLFVELLELVDMNFNTQGEKSGCPRFHFMPRFVRDLPDNGKEILSMNEVLMHIIRNSGPLIPEEELAHLLTLSQYQWQNYADNLKGMVVTCPGMKPCSIRVDQLDRDQDNEDVINYPVIVHFGIRPPQLSYAGNPVYQKAWREYVKFRHLLANMPKPSPEDKRKLANKECQLQEMRMTSKMKRDVTVAVSSHGFYRSGIMCDVVQHAMLLPVLVCHLRFHQSLDVLTERIGYQFKNRYLLQLALTHPSYRENFGTNPDHARNSLTNCGIRQPEYGDRRIHYMHTRKRGINTLINIMSRFGARQETESKITHNERLEFLGDAVVEFLSSIHLFHIFPNLEEGGLATYRAAIVQNQHLAVLAEKLGLDEFMLYAHGSDLCHDFELRHAMANCFEALMGAIFLDAGIEEADKVFSATLFLGEELQHDIWVNYPPHPLQMQEPNGDRKWMEHFPILKNLANFELSIGVEFRHIRLLARAFTDRSIGPNNLTLGSNQRLEFLGDTVLQLVASEYLYRFFPEHHEGHLSLLRSSLVNNRTQAVVCDDLDMTKYAMYSQLKYELKTKDRADLLEAFLGAIYIDRGLDYCRVFCDVCFFPRLHQFIMNQDWNDPKSKLQQCCLTLRTMDGGEPDIPIYKVIECKGPTNTRVYTVAVYFRNKRLAKASGHSIQTAEMNAAREALDNSKDLFPQLDHQRRVIEKSVKIQVGVNARGYMHYLHGNTQNSHDQNKREDQENDRGDKSKGGDKRLRREGDLHKSREGFQDGERRNRYSHTHSRREEGYAPKEREKYRENVRRDGVVSERVEHLQNEEKRDRHVKSLNGREQDNENAELLRDEKRKDRRSNDSNRRYDDKVRENRKDYNRFERPEHYQEEERKKRDSKAKFMDSRNESQRTSKNRERNMNNSERSGGKSDVNEKIGHKAVSKYTNLRNEGRLKENEKSRIRDTKQYRNHHISSERSMEHKNYCDKSENSIRKERDNYESGLTSAGDTEGESSKQIYATQPALFLWSGKKS